MFGSMVDTDGFLRGKDCIAFLCKKLNFKMVIYLLTLHFAGLNKKKIEEKNSSF